MRHAIESLAERVGSDPLLIQAAGGNLSWKDGEVLWVKSSGAWLANARVEDMFVPIDLAGVRGCIASGRESYVDFRLHGSMLRPSIETALHALMPQPVVAHLHAVDAIVYSVLVDAQERLAARLDGLDWMWVPYRKPGAALASEVAAGLATASAVPDVLVLANHGVVFCGDDDVAIEALYRDVLDRLRTTPRSVAPSPADDAVLPGYTEATDPATRSLATDPVNRRLVAERWVMYPDHAVFLGPSARVHRTLDEARDAVAGESGDDRARRPCVVVEDRGVWLADEAPQAAWAMLDCYARVCLRCAGPDAVTRLSDADISALLDWEAERYRKSLAH